MNSFTKYGTSTAFWETCVANALLNILFHLKSNMAIIEWTFHVFIYFFIFVECTIHPLMNCISTCTIHEERCCWQQLSVFLTLNLNSPTFTMGFTSVVFALSTAIITIHIKPHYKNFLPRVL